MNSNFLAGQLTRRPLRSAVFTLAGLLASAHLASKLLNRSPSYEQMHLSVFAFRDVNRNGVYDLGDRPYAGIPAVIERPRGEKVQTNSNIAGFANFNMSYGNDDVPVNRPGDYTVTVEPPRDWIVTTGNPTQIIRLEHLREAPVGLVANQLYEHVGVASSLSISGSVWIGDGDPEAGIARFLAVNPKGEVSDIAVGEDGQFSFAATPGDWQLQLSMVSGESAFRAIRVADYPVRVSRIEPGVVEREQLPVLRTIGFDDVTSSDSLQEIPNGYASLNWNNWVATHQKFYRKASHVNGTVSSEYLAYTSAGHPATIWSECPIDFVGAFLTMTLERGENHDVIVRAWRAGELAYEDRFKASSSGPVWFAADYRSIDRLEFLNQAYWHAGGDDFQFRFPKR